MAEKPGGCGRDCMIYEYFDLINEWILIGKIYKGEWNEIIRLFAKIIEKSKKIGCKIRSQISREKNVCLDLYAAICDIFWQICRKMNIKV